MTNCVAMPVLGAAKLKAFLVRAEAKPKPWQEEALIKTAALKHPVI